MRRIITFSLFLFSFVLNAQFGFEEIIISDNSKFIEGPRSVNAADFDGDGDMDLLVSSFYDEKITWFENIDGQGTYGTPNIITAIADNAYNAIAADIDNDGDMDVVSAYVDDNRVIWFENTDGLGTFGASYIISSSATDADGIVAGDINGDGTMDVLYSSLQNDKIAWHGNIDGQGTFGGEIPITTTANGVRSVSLVDIDDDGDLDILAALSNDSQIVWYENTNGLGLFSTANVITSLLNFPTTVVASDIDGDNDLDIITASDNDRIIWFENLDGFGNYGSFENIIYNSEGAHNIRVLDIDNDSDMDVISSSLYVNKVSIYENLDGAGNFGTQQVISNLLHPNNYLSMSDIDSDGFIDVLYTTLNDFKVAWKKNLNGTGSFGIEENIAGYVKDVREVAIADLNGDGFHDVVSSSYQDNKIAWYSNNNGDGFGNQNIITVNSTNSNTVKVGDLDGDGDVDIIAVLGLADIVWYDNVNGLGNFSEYNLIDSSTFTITLFVVDVDGDNDLDIVAGSTSNDSIKWYENIDGLGNFSVGQTVATSAANPESLFVTDFDGDGDNDVFYGGYFENGWIENLDGQGTFGTPIIIDVNERWRSVIGVDMDGDGDNDIVGAYTNVVFWKENIDGQGNFGQSIILSNDVVAYNLIASDLDNDSDLDILFSNNSGDYLGWFESIDGQGTFSPEQVINPNQDGIDALAVGDLDNDGRLDIVTGNRLDDKLIWHKSTLLSNQIIGDVNFDSTGNGCNGNNSNISNVLIETSNGVESYSTFTNLAGNYYFFVGEDEFTTQMVSGIPNYFSISPNSYVSNFVGVGNIDEANFCIEPSATVNDLNIALYPLSDARPGFDASYQLVYKNLGTTTLSGTIELIFNSDKLSILEASEPVASQTGDSVTFDYVDLAPFEYRAITISFNVAAPPTTEIGDILVFEATVNPVVGDETEEDNVFEFEQTVIGSYDPNDIQVLEGDEIFLNEADDYLHYIIRFQNTGTASAINVRVTNELDPNLDWTTMQLENISHSNRVEITDGSSVEFIFENINLPDATTNEPESHGYIQYKIKPISTVDIGDSMANNANIYFDFNPPILTNTVTTTIIENLGTENYAFNGFKLYPNPSKDLVNIKSTQSVMEIEITNQIGQVISQIKNKEGINTFSIENLPMGIYFVKLVDENSNSVVKKLLKK